MGLFQVTQRNGERWNAARAYLHSGVDSSISRHPNLQVFTDTQAVRIVFEGKRAVGVEVRRGDTVESLRARREVIVSSGAFSLPQLLMASGIGPAAHLSELGVSIVAAAPEVGRNLQEHVDVLFYKLKISTTELLGASVSGG